MAGAYDVTWEVSIAFGKGVGDTVVDADFTNITKYVTGPIQSTRGRASERETFPPGQLALTLLNDTRIFDPDNASGPFYGNLLPMRPIRVRCTYGGTTKYRFRGYVLGWPQSFQGVALGTVRLTALDWFTVAANAPLPESAYASEVTADSPSAWYRFDDDTTVVQDSSGNNRWGTYIVGTTTTGIITGSTSKGLTAAANNQTSAYAPAFSGSTWTVEFWFKVPTDNLQNSANFYLIYPDTQFGTGLTVVYTTGVPGPPWVDTLQVSLSDGSGGGVSWSTNYSRSTQAGTGQTHHIAVTKSGTTATVYYDGTSQTTGTVSAGATFWGSVLQMLNQAASSGSWVVDEVAWYSTALSAARIAAHASAGWTAYAGETVTARMARVMTAAGYGSLPTSFDTSTQTVQACNYGGGSTNLLDYLLALWRTEGGQSRLFMAADGTLTFHGRYHDTLAGTGVAAAFTDVSSSTLPYDSIGDAQFGVDRIANVVTVQRSGGSAQTVSDATSINLYGRTDRGLPPSTGLLGQLDTECLDRANAELYRLKDPHYRITDLTITPSTSGAAATLAPVARDSEIGQRVSVRKLPLNQGSAWTRSVTIEGVSETVQIQPGPVWQLRYLTAPTDVTDVWFVLDSSALDVNRLGF